MNMKCTLLIPDLIWPEPAAEFRVDPLPAIETILAKSEHETLPQDDPDIWLCRQFGVKKQHDWPIAPLSLKSPPEELDCWLRVDPVHLQIRRDQLYLLDPALLELSRQEADSLIASLNRHFEGDDFLFRAERLDCWHLRLPQVPMIETTPLTAVAGKSIAHFLPKGTEAARWHSVFNEIQMLLYQHPVNDARERAGKLTVNSLWLWGGGILPNADQADYSSIAGNDPLVHGLARQGQISSMALPDNAADWIAALDRHQQHLAVIDSLRLPALHRDRNAWELALRELERHWFAPLLFALKDKRIGTLAIVATGPHAVDHFEITPSQLLKFWRKPKPILSYSK